MGVDTTKFLVFLMELTGLLAILPVQPVEKEMQFFICSNLLQL